MSKNQSSASSGANEQAAQVPSPHMLWSFKQLSIRYGVHVATVRRWSREGQIRTIRIGRLKRVRDAERALFEGGPPRAVR